MKDLAVREKVLGTEHPSTATTYNNIATIYQDMGKLEQAGFVETVGNQNFYWDAVEALKGIESQNAVTV